MSGKARKRDNWIDRKKERTIEIYRERERLYKRDKKI